MNLVGEYKIRWLTDSSSRSILGIILLFLVKFALIFIEYRILNKNSKTLLVDSKICALEKGIIKVSLICVSYVALELFFKDFERLFRIPLFLSFLFLALYLSYTKIDLKKISFNLINFVDFYFVYFIYFYISFSGWFATVLIPVFTQNSLLNFF